MSRPCKLLVLPAATAGFTLLEVLIAISILGLGLTAILTSQTGLFSSASHAANLSVATGLARCKMTEVELELLRDGYPLLDQNDDGPCCAGESRDDFSCSWKIEHVELPPLPELGATDLDEEGLGADPGSLGLLGALNQVDQTGGAVLGAEADLGSVGDLMGGSAAAAAGSMLPMVMEMVYPILQGTFEGSIRRITVVVHWKEGLNDRDLDVAQYVTDPVQGGFDPLAEDRLDEATRGVGEEP
jgi:general secretion pathway protein I